MFNSELEKLENSVLDNRRLLDRAKRRVEDLQKSLRFAERHVLDYQERIDRALVAIEDEKRRHAEVLASMENWSKLANTGKIEDIRRKLTWGTFGKSGKDPLKYVPLCDLTTEHIEAILATQTHISDDVARVLYMELGFRQYNYKRLYENLGKLAAMK